MVDIVGDRRRAYTGVVTHARQTLGAEAEAAAAAFLQRSGLAVLERNVRLGHGEIDVVCRDGDVIVFVEVKCRRARWGDGPAAAVSAHKQRRLTRLAQHWLKWRGREGARCRFDVVAVTVNDDDRVEVRHLPAAFDAAAW